MADPTPKSNSSPDPKPSDVAEIAEGLHGQKKPSGAVQAAKGLLAIVFLYLFMCSINVMGDGLKTIAEIPQNKSFMEKNIFSLSENHLVGLCVGIIITSMVQSSSFTTSLTVALVATGELDLNHAIPIVMGANIGTTVTCVLVSLGQIGKRREFRRAFSASLVHDMFNLSAVALLFPLNWKFGIIEKPANWIATKLEGGGQIVATDTGFIKTATKQVSHLLKWALQSLGLHDKTWLGIVMAILGVALLFVSLIYMVKMLRSVVLRRVEGIFDRVLFRNGAISFTFGIMLTALVQSSSVTTSLVVPLVGAGMLRLRQVFPYTLGANIGTTVTALLASLAVSSNNPAMHAASVAVAFAHLMFNGMGTIVFWPLSWIPIGMAKAFAKLATRLRYYAILYVVVAFVLIPAAVVVWAAWHHHGG